MTVKREFILCIAVPGYARRRVRLALIRLKQILWL